MKNKNASALDTWLTPASSYRAWDAQFHFDKFDPCPPNNNIEVFDGLKATWAKRVFCNPPYSLTLKEAFVKKALHSVQTGDSDLVVLLLPVSTSTKLFHDIIAPNGKVDFIKGRLKFEGIDREGNWVNANQGMSKLPEELTTGRPQITRSGQFDSMLVIFVQN